MLRFEFVDNIDATFTAHYLVVWTNFFNACTHLHADHAPSSDDSLLIYYDLR